MRETWRNLSTNLASFIAPGLVLLLLGIQVAFGLRGFDRPDDSLLYVLQVPGALLGWGGVAMLCPLLVWMILDWWGYDLNGFALKGLGSAVLGVAVGTLVGLSGGLAAGGLVGAGLAAVLTETVGPVIAWILLLLMAAPACVLAFSLQRGLQPTTSGLPKESSDEASGPQEAAPTPAVGQPARDPANTDRSKSSPAKPAHRPPRYPTGGPLKRLFGRLIGRRAAPEEDSAWYPLPRFDRHGNELPMDFGRARDVGGIRFADEGEAETPNEASGERPDPAAGSAGASTTEERLPTIPELLAGNFGSSSELGQGAGGPDTGDPSGGPRELVEDMPDDGPIHVDGRGRPLSPAAQALTSEAAETETARTGTAKTGTAKTGTAGSDARAPETSEGDFDGPATGALDFIASHARASRASGSDAPTTRREDALAPGVRYADEPEVEKPGEDDPALKEDDRSPLKARRGTPSNKTTPSKKDEEASVEDQLSQAVRDAVKGPAARASDGIGQQSARTIRRTLRQSVAGLQADGGSDRHLAKLEAMGLFDSFDGPADNAPSERTGNQGSDRDGSRAEDGAAESAGATDAAAAGTSTAVRKKAAAKKRKKAAAKKAARKTTAPKKAATKKAAAKKAARKKAAGKKPTGKKKATRKKTARKKTAPKPSEGRAEKKQDSARGRDVPGQLLFPDDSDSGPQARQKQTPARKQTVKGAVRARQSLLEGLRIERLDPLFRRSVRASLERGSASPVLLTRTLGVPFARAQALIERLVSAGVLKSRTEAGSYPLAITRKEWESL